MREPPTRGCTQPYLVPLVDLRQVPVVGLLAHLPEAPVGEPGPLAGCLHREAGRDASAVLAVDQREALEVPGGEGRADLWGETPKRP